MGFRPLQEGRQKLTSELNRRQQVNGEKPLPLIRRHPFRRPVIGDAGVVDKNIERVPLLEDFADLALT